MKRPEQRFEFSAMPQRAKWSLPEGKRIAVYTVVNVEEWDIEKPIAREYVTSPAGVSTVPNVPFFHLERLSRSMFPSPLSLSLNPSRPHRPLL